MGTEHLPGWLVKLLATALAVIVMSTTVTAQSNPRYSSLALGSSTGQPAATTGTIRMPNGGSLRTTTTSGHTLKVQAWNGSAWVDMMTVTNAATPTVAFNASMTVGGSALLPFADPGADRIFYYRNSDDTLQPLTLGGTCSLSGGTLTCTIPQPVTADMTVPMLMLSAFALGAVWRRKAAQ